MTARFITNQGVEEASDTEFFSRIFGHAPRTPAEREAEWRAEIEKFANMIERGNEWAVPCPCLADARKLVAERAEQRMTERADLEPKKRPDGRWQVAA